MTTLPTEIVDHIFDFLLLKTSPDASPAARLCRVNRRTYNRAVGQLYRAPQLSVKNVASFLDALESDIKRESLKTSRAADEGAIGAVPAAADDPQIEVAFGRKTSLVSQVRLLAFISTERSGRDCGAHEHVDGKTVLRCVELTKDTIEGIVIDMACSQVACGLDFDAQVSPHQASMPFHLPLLKTLTCRCPKGYLPEQTRKLLKQTGIGHSPNLATLQLVWTAPGPFDSPGHVASLSQTLDLCPNVTSLCIVDTQRSFKVRHAYLASVQLPHFGPYFPEVLVHIPPTELLPTPSSDSGDGQSASGHLVSYEIDADADADADPPHNSNDSATTVNKTRARGSSTASQFESQAFAVQARAHHEAAPLAVSTSIARAIVQLDPKVYRPPIQAHLATVYTPRMRRQNVRTLWGEASRQIASDAGWQAFVGLLQQDAAQHA